jgi:hypothetical protein
MADNNKRTKVLEALESQFQKTADNNKRVKFTEQEKEKEKEDVYDECVLVSGGFNFTCGRSSTEIYNTHTKKIERGPDMAYARYDHTMTTLPNGQIFVCGGRNDDLGYIRLCELYNPKTRTFTKLGNLEVGRWGHTATLIKNGMVMIYGGSTYDDKLRTLTAVTAVELFDPERGAFGALPKMFGRRRIGHAAVLLPNGELFVSGGNKDTTDVYESFRFSDDMSLLTAHRSAVDPTIRSGHALALDKKSGKVVIFGGYKQSLSVIDPVSFDLMPPPIADQTLLPYEDMCVAALSNGTFFVAGGTDNNVKSSCIVNLEAGTVTAGPSFSEDRRDAAAAVFTTRRL